MIYICKCDKCSQETIIDTDKDKIGINRDCVAYVTAHGYLCTKCVHCGKMESYAVWRGMDGTRYPRTGLFG